MMKPCGPVFRLNELGGHAPKSVVYIVKSPQFEWTIKVHPYVRVPQLNDPVIIAQPPWIVVHPLLAAQPQADGGLLVMVPVISLYAVGVSTGVILTSHE
jgi:hypothetical protein